MVSDICRFLGPGEVLVSEMPVSSNRAELWYWKCRFLGPGGDKISRFSGFKERNSYVSSFFTDSLTFSELKYVPKNHLQLEIHVH